MAIFDMIKNAIVKGFSATTLTTAEIIVTIGFSAIIGIFVYVVYRLTSGKDFYNRNFNKTLALLPLITAGIMLAMQNNLILSLGMVGALSIVRFRNAVKDSMDLTFLFWSISVGIITGVGLFELSIIISLGIAVFMIILDLFPTLKSPCLAVISADNADCYDKIKECAEKYTRRCRVRSKNISSKGMELILETKIKNEVEFSKAIAGIDGVTSISILAHDGEVRF